MFTFRPLDITSHLIVVYSGGTSIVYPQTFILCVLPYSAFIITIIIIIIIICYHLYAGYIQLYIPGTSHVPRLHSVATILDIQLMVHVMLFPMIHVL
jgi:hypothetical protein